MKTSEITYLGKLRTNAVHLKSGNIVITDAPTDNKGKGEYFSPTDLLATSLASCMLTIIGIVAEENNFCITNTKAEVTKVMGDKPRRIIEIIIDFYFNKDFSAKEKTLINNAINNCPVGKSLNPEIKQIINLNF